MSIRPTLNAEFLLPLADGTRLTLCAGDETAARVLGFLARAAQLSPAPDPLPPDARRLLVVTDVGHATRDNLPHMADAICELVSPNAPRRRRRMDLTRSPSGKLQRPDPKPPPEEQWFWQQLTRLSAAIARATQPRGGVLLHSGLAVYPHPRPLPRVAGQGEWGGGDEHGILLAGRSGVGKSTASRRLPPPWRALADDVTLVVRDVGGTHWAHPWPTWSCFFGPEAGDGSDNVVNGCTWAVQEPVPLRAIVVLEQGPVDRIEPLGPGHAVALLSELAQQASEHLVQTMPPDEVVAFHYQRFDNLCALARGVPAYLLHVSLDGAFWTEIERVLCEDPRDR